MAEQRVQKVLADQGICSRREAERLIAAGKVKVNGHPVGLGDKMDPDFDKVMIDGKTVRIVRKRQYTYIMLHKPRGYLTTRSDDRGRKTVMDLVSDVRRRQRRGRLGHAGGVPGRVQRQCAHRPAGGKSFRRG